MTHQSWSLDGREGCKARIILTRGRIKRFEVCVVKNQSFLSEVAEELEADKQVWWSEFRIHAFKFSHILR